MFLSLLRPPRHKRVYVSGTVVLEEKLLRRLALLVVMVIVMVPIATGRGTRRNIRERVVECLLVWLRLLWLR